MISKRELKFIYILAILFGIFTVVILGNLALPIMFRLFMKIIQLFYPFIFGFFIAFLLHTVVDKIEEQGINRVLAVLLVFITFIILLVYLISSLIPIVYEQINELETQIPELYKSLQNFFDLLWQKLHFIPEKYRFNLKDLESWLNSYIVKFHFRIDHLDRLLDSFNVIVLTPIIAYYFLYDYNNIKQAIKRYLLKKNKKILLNFLKDADEGVGNYFRGLILVMNLMAITSALGFYLVGLKYPLLFGFIVGYTNAIPIIGNYIGGIPAFLFALTKSWRLALMSVLVVVIVQLLESNIVTPYIQSKSISCHPLWIILAFIVFGHYFGFLGMIFAIPLLAIIMLVIKYVRIYLRLRKLNNKGNLLHNNS